MSNEQIGSVTVRSPREEGGKEEDVRPHEESCEGEGETCDEGEDKEEGSGFERDLDDTDGVDDAEDEML
jgi:hypothetical protein